MLVLSFLCAQCLEEGDCQKQASTLLKVAFISKETGKSVKVSVTRVVADSTFTVYSSSNSKAVSTLNIPVDPYDTITPLVFTILKEADKQLTISYTRHAILIAPDCGPENLLANLSIVNTDFDSLKLVTPLISVSKTANIDIYR